MGIIESERRAMRNDIRGLKACGTTWRLRLALDRDDLRMRLAWDLAREEATIDMG